MIPLQEGKEIREKGQAHLFLRGKKNSPSHVIVHENASAKIFLIFLVSLFSLKSYIGHWAYNGHTSSKTLALCAQIRWHYLRGSLSAEGWCSKVQYGICLQGTPTTNDQTATIWKFSMPESFSYPQIKLSLYNHYTDSMDQETRKVQFISMTHLNSLSTFIGMGGPFSCATCEFLNDHDHVTYLTTSLLLHPLTVTEMHS